MNRKRSMSKMRIACIVTALLGGVLFFGVAPQVLPEVMYSGRGGVVPFMYWVDLAYIEMVGALCFASLWEAWKICGEIARDNSFSQPNVKSLRRISRYMSVACGMMSLGLAPLLCYYNSVGLDQLGLELLGLVALGVCISLVFALFASAMAELIRKGAELKDENDLTI